MLWPLKGYMMVIMQSFTISITFYSFIPKYEIP